MEWGWYRASCPSRKEVLDNRSGSSYYHGNKICHREKAPAPSDSAEPGPLTNTLTNIRKSAGGHSGQGSYLYPQKMGPKVPESTQ